MALHRHALRACDALGRPSQQRLVNAAAVVDRGTLLETTPDFFDWHVNVNLKAPFFTMQAAVKDMLSRGAPGSIVNILSTSMHVGQSILAAYVA